MQIKLKKAEETEQKLLGDLQRKEAELNRTNKQLDKFKKEGASASGALQEKIDFVEKKLLAAEEEVSKAAQDRDDAVAQMEEKGKQLEWALERPVQVEKQRSDQAHPQRRGSNTNIDSIWWRRLFNVFTHPQLCSVLVHIRRF